MSRVDSNLEDVQILLDQGVLVDRSQEAPHSIVVTFHISIGI